MKPVAWEVWAKKGDADWKMYSLYKTEVAAKYCVKVWKSALLKMEVRPLYKKEK